MATLLATGIALKRCDTQIRVITIHNDYLDPLLKRRYAKWVVRRLLSSFDHVVAVSDTIRRQLEDVVSTPITVIPAYIEGESNVTLTPGSEDLFPGEVPTLAVSAYEVDRISAETDLYGLDVVAKIYAELRVRRPIRLGIFVAKDPRGRRDRDYLDSIVELARSVGDPEDVRCFIGEPLRPVFSESNIVYLRPSRTDGDAVSVREALAAGTPVVASDVIRRPAAVATVPINDVTAWVSVIENAITAGDSPSTPPIADTAESGNDLFNASDYVELYRRWIREAAGFSG